LSSIPSTSFEVKPVPNLPSGTDPAAAEIGRVKDQLRQMRATLGETPKADLVFCQGRTALPV
jgi:hypothetical protein